MNTLFECIYALSNLKRFPCHRVNQVQNVATHSFNVAMISLYIADVDKVDCDKAILLQKALLHDLVEGRMGDIAAPTREYSPELYAQIKMAEESMLKEIFKEAPVDYTQLAVDAKKGTEWEIIKLADLIERVIYLNEERRSGNELAESIYKSTLKKIKTKEFKALLKKYPTANEFLWHYLSITK